ncbi:MAG: helix-turn-helix domain-containing protein [Oscillospiraceae bacterium]|jgi:transcriptional regulator with XRE-family HTH domain|nr:helix-turn-helix domain-containing protein [Oscillospiraceae bacterium]
MDIGIIIKKLRRGLDLTQEELAEQIGVTSQAVSKWESGAGLPDISQVVPLARALGVNTDVLFGTNREEDDKRVAEVEARTSELFELESGDGVDRYEEVTELWRGLARDLPYNWYAQFQLAQYLASMPSDDKQREAVQLLKRVLDRCTEPPARADATSRLMFAYSALGEFDKAQALSETLSGTDFTREGMLARVARSRIDKRLKENTDISAEEAEALLAPIVESVKAFAIQTYSNLSSLAECKRSLGLADKDEYIRLFAYSKPLDELIRIGDAEQLKDVDSIHYMGLAHAYNSYGDADNALESFALYADSAPRIDVGTILRILDERWSEEMRSDPRFVAAKAKLLG